MEERDVRDLSRIGVRQDWELRNWSAEFGVTPQELKTALATVGVRVTAVRRYFEERKKP